MTQKERQLQKQILKAFQRAVTGQAALHDCYVQAQMLQDASPVFGVEQAQERHTFLNELEERFLENFWDTVLQMNYLLYLRQNTRRHYYDKKLFATTRLLQNDDIVQYLTRLNRLGQLKSPPESNLMKPEIMKDDLFFGETFKAILSLLDSFFETADKKRPKAFKEMVLLHYDIEDDQAVKDKMEMDFCIAHKRRLGHYKLSTETKDMIDQLLNDPENRHDLLVDILCGNADQFFPMHENNKILAIATERELSLARRAMALMPPRLEDKTEISGLEEGHHCEEDETHETAVVAAVIPQRSHTSEQRSTPSEGARIVPFPQPGS